jgi:hypothetical protein
MAKCTSHNVGGAKIEDTIHKNKCQREDVKEEC